MATRQYIGARYVPVFKGEWSANTAYEPLSIVSDGNGNSYTSKRYVPVGIHLSNDSYWAMTGSFNAQVEHYRNEIETKINGYNTVQGMIDDNANLKIGMTARTNGFHEVDDGGAAWYLIAGAGVPNGMDCIQVGNGLYANLIITESYVTPEMFGAVGNGVVNDTASVQSAFNVGGNVVLNGTYLIDSPINANLKVNVTGHGTLKGNGIIVNANETVIKDITIENSATDGIRCIDSDNVLVNGVKVINSTNSGFIAKPVTKSIQGIMVCNSVFDGCCSGASSSNRVMTIYFNSGDEYFVENSSIVNCKCLNNGHIAIFPNGTNNTVDNCIVSKSGLVYSPNSCGIWIHDSIHTMISNTVIEKCSGYSLRIVKASKVSVSNTQVHNCTGTYGVGLIYDASQTGRLVGDEANTDITFDNCIIDGNANGLFVNGYRNVTFSNCYFINNTNIAINIVNNDSHGTNVSFNGCTSNRNGSNKPRCEDSSILGTLDVWVVDHPYSNKYQAVGNLTEVDVLPPIWASSMVVYTNTCMPLVLSCKMDTSRQLTYSQVSSTVMQLFTYQLSFNNSTKKLSLTEVGGCSVDASGFTGNFTPPTANFIIGIEYMI